MSINTDINEIEHLLSSLRSKVDDETEDFLKEISVLNDEVELLKTETEFLDDKVEDLLFMNNQLKAQVAQLEIELIEAVMQNKRL